MGVAEEDRAVEYVITHVAVSNQLIFFILEPCYNSALNL